MSTVRKPACGRRSKPTSASRVAKRGQSPFCLSVIIFGNDISK
jgi:hypothetical protein